MTGTVADRQGGGSGIGLAIAERLAADGMAVAIFDRDADAGAAAAAKIVAAGGAAEGVAVDVAERDQIDAGVEQVRGRLRAADRAREQRGGRGLRPVPEDHAREVEPAPGREPHGTFQCCQAVVPGMVDAGWGRIVNISSSSAQGGQPLMTHYVASKAGMIGFTKALALELGPLGITVNTIPPGFIDTPMLRASEAKGLLGEGVEHHAAQTPVRRAGRPEDIAATCAFLVSEEASYITGQVIGVNGGRNTG